MTIIYVLIFIILLILLLSKLVLNTVFGKRCEGSKNLKYFTANDFEGLSAKPIEFPSNKGQILRGNIYTDDSIKEYKGLIVFVHGMGGGHLSYTTEINTFAKAGFMVIGYDNTGTCTSEGKNLKGFFQSVIDLKYALDYISKGENLNKYNVALVGHSWGAYSVCQVLQYNPNVKAVVAFSGFNNSSNVICDSMKAMLKVNVSFLKPFFTVINFLTFGKDGIKNTASILNNTDVPVLALHGTADTSALLGNSISANVEENAHIKVMLYEGRYHNVYQTKESEQYLNDTFANIEQVKKQYKGKMPEEEIKKLYGNIDYKKMTEEDNTVMDTVIKFIEDKMV